MNRQHKHDVVIVGCGVAGITLALQLPDNLSIALISKGELKDSTSYLAQGGIAGVLAKKDISSHVEDTLRVGCGLCNEAVVKHVISSSPAALQKLLSIGVPFTTKRDNSLHLIREAGHSKERILHVDDATGKALFTTLERCLSQKNNVTVFTNFVAIDLLTSKKLKHKQPRNSCHGLYALNTASGQVHTFSAKATVLATGGASKVYLYTSGSTVCSGDGIAMAARGGATIVNMEFNQFHPTCLFNPQKNMLLSEAMRGAGARLKLPNCGKHFMADYHPNAELAPRDIVARAIDHEMKINGLSYVLLDISHRSPQFIKKRFPTIYANCLEIGIDLTKQALPVVPAAHYTCGGIGVDINGQSDIKNLYAIGEAACSGLHGANRLASNSLLECVVFAQQAASHIANNLTAAITNLPLWDDSKVKQSREEVIIHQCWHEVRQLMWNYVGIVRSNKRLNLALNRLNIIQQDSEDYYRKYNISTNLIELRNLTLIALLTVKSALARHESRGLHYNIDYPQINPLAKDSVMRDQQLMI